MSISQGASPFRTWFAALFLALLVVVAAPPPIAGAAFPGDNGRIAFERYSETFASSVATLAPDGTGASTLLDLARSPAWSPDGTKVALLAVEPQASRATIHVVNADGSGLTNVGPPREDAGPDSVIFVDNPAWSPDGNKIAYEKNLNICGGHTCVTNARGIWTINVDGTGETRVASGGHNPAWSPDGSTIALDTGSLYSLGDIFVVEADGSPLVNLTNTPTVDEREPNWSPDATKLVFGRGSTDIGQGDIDVIRADGAPLGSLVGGPTVDRMAAWSPDGTKVVFRSERDGGGLYTVNADGTVVARLAESGARDYDPDWQPLAGPRRADFKNASHFCKAERAFLGDERFAARYGGGANAHGKCVSSNH